MTTTTYLSNLHARVRLALRDTNAAAYLWTDADLNENIARALDEFSDASPIEATTTIAVTESTKVYDLSDIADLAYHPAAIFAVEWPYVSNTTPNNIVPFRVWANTLYVLTSEAPQAGDTILIWYWASHALTESTRTITDEDEALILIGATAYAGFQAQRAAAGQFTQPDATGKDYKSWASPEISRFNRALMDRRQERGMAPANTVRWNTSNI